MTARVFISTIPFGAIDPQPVDALTAANLDFRINPLGRRLQPEEVADAIGNSEIVIAGTEPITAEVMAACPNLRAICRVGIGLDNVDLLAARERNIAVSYTPDEPSAAVAELAVGLMLDLSRHISRADHEIRNAHWQRNAGRRLAQSTVGVVGVGRIGGRVIRHLNGGFPGVRILANDPVRNPDFDDAVTWTDLDAIYEQCDIISLHVPLTLETRGIIGAAELSRMRPDCILVNTARGGIIDERDLATALKDKRIAGAALDVFETEPYTGPLTQLDNAVLTCHLGSMTRDCRARMEIEATDEAIRYSRNAPFRNPVPESEYELAANMMEAK